jgi:hypothetical protein
MHAATKAFMSKSFVTLKMDEVRPIPGGRAPGYFGSNEGTTAFQQRMSAVKRTSARAVGFGPAPTVMPPPASFHSQ